MSFLLALRISLTCAELKGSILEWDSLYKASQVNSILLECDVGSPSTNFTCLFPSSCTVVDNLQISLVFDPNALFALENLVINSASIVNVISYSGSSIEGEGAIT